MREQYSQQCCNNQQFKQLGLNLVCGSYTKVWLYAGLGVRRLLDTWDNEDLHGRELCRQ
jgi:hypothetical protein